MQRLALMTALLLLTACGTQPYTPTEYELRAGLIPSFRAAPTTFENRQPSKEQTIVYSYMGSKMASNLHDITEVMVRQAAKELQKNAAATAGPAKTVGLRVKSLLSTYGVMSWTSKIVYDVELGSGEKFEKVTTHGSGVLVQDLNGCIAEGVMNLLKDERVIAYLGS
jgi:hypothetical protein